MSSSEAEFQAATTTIREASYLLQVCKENYANYIDFENPHLRVDNKSAISMLESPKIEGRTKHMALRVAYISENLFQRAKESFKLKYVSTNENLADIFTKPVSGTTLDSLNPARNTWGKVVWDDHYAA